MKIGRLKGYRPVNVVGLVWLFEVDVELILLVFFHIVVFGFVNQIRRLYKA